jgi:carbonic anhydrase/acetyltransferase-like protein (isoleucine patch superfamily)
MSDDPVREAAILEILGKPRGPLVRRPFQKGETMQPDRRLIALDDTRRPTVTDAWLAPNATVVGQVSVGAASSVWYAAVLRGDNDSISMLEQSNHTDPGSPVHIGRRVTVGHRAVLHGCWIDDDVLIGMGAVVMNGTRIGSGSLIAAGAVLLENTVIPPGSLVAGMPGKVRRETTEDERSAISASALRYVELASVHAAAVSAT